MAALVGQHQISTFVSPVNGSTPIDANTVRSNDNTIKTAYDAHDSDGTIHIQSSTLAARPAAGTAGLVWFTSDGFRIYYDNGSVWTEAAYLQSGGGTITGNVLITGTLGVTGVITASTGLVVTTGGLTVSAGTTAVQALTATAVTTASLSVSTASAFIGITSTTGTNSAYIQFSNTAGGYLFGVDNSSGSSIGLGVYAAGITAPTTRSIVLLVGAVKALTATETAVTIPVGVTLAAQTLTATTGVLSSTLSTTQLTITTAVGKIIPGATSISLRNNADAADNMLVTDAGAVTFRSTVGGITTLTCTTVTATNLGGTLSTAAQASVTSLGTLTSLTTSGAITITAAVSKIIPGATSISHRNNADNADNLLISDNGDAAHRANVFIGTTGTISALSSTAFGSTTTRVLTVYDATGGTANAGTLEIGSSQTVGSGTIGKISFSNPAINSLGVGDNRAGQITCFRDGANNSAGLSFLVMNAGTGLNAMSMSHLGNILLNLGTAASAPLTIPHGVAPTSPTNGDIWTTSAGLFVRINGATVGPLT